MAPLIRDVRWAREVAGDLDRLEAKFGRLEAAQRVLEQYLHARTVADLESGRLKAKGWPPLPPRKKNK